MAQTPHRPSVYGGHHKGSPKVFLLIYLIVALAIGAAIFFLKPSDNAPSIDELLASENASKSAADQKPQAGQPSAKPKTKSKPKADPDDEKPVTVANTEKTDDDPAEKAEAKPDPETESKPPKPSLSAQEEKQIEELYPFPEIPPLIEYVNNWIDVPQRAFPKMVAIRKPVDFELNQGGQVVARGKLPAGSKMVPVQLNGDQLVLSGGGASPISVTVPVDDTDFKELIQSRYETFVEMRKAQVISQRKAERNRRLGAIALEQSLSDWNDGSDPRFDPIKASLQKGDAGIYSLADATKWRWGGTEAIDGTEYETAFVLIVSEAAFGVTELELKVLIQEGKVAHWLDPATGEEI